MIHPLSFSRRMALALVAAASLLLSACGGGGGGGDTSTRAEPATAASLQFAPSDSLAGTCTVDGEKSFARSYLDEVYLWYDRIVSVDATAYQTVQSYFDALLVRSPDGSGRSTDRFSAVLTSRQADDMLNAAAKAAGNLLADSTAAVPLTSAVRSPAGRKVGYLLFDKQGQGAQDALIPAFEALKAAQVQDLVLDLRNNPGGYLYVANAAASMVAGPQQVGQVFEELRYNDKRQDRNEAQYFIDSVRVPESRYPAGYALPQLGLPRLYVLATGMTCSASESIINSLRGVGIDVVVVGQTTCGKPYGFHRKDNCGKAYFAIDFKGTNAQGFGDYAGGFAPQCAVLEDASAALGSTSEPLLAAALHHIDTGSCPAPSRRTKLEAVRTVDPMAGIAGRLLLGQAP